MVFGHKELTNLSKKNEPQKRVQWARSDPKHVTKMGAIFLPKGLNKSVVKIEFRKGLLNPSSMVFGHKGLTNLSKNVVDSISTLLKVLIDKIKTISNKGQQEQDA